MAEEIKKAEAAVENKAAEAIEDAEAVAKKEAEKAAAEAAKIAKKSGEEEAQKWLEGKLASIETSLGTRIAAIQTWFQEEMAKFQEKLFNQQKEALATKESSTPPNSTAPPTNPEKAAEKNGSQSETSETKNQKPTRKRHRI